MNTSVSHSNACRQRRSRRSLQRFTAMLALTYAQQKVAQTPHRLQHPGYLKPSRITVAQVLTRFGAFDQRSTRPLACSLTDLLTKAPFLLNALLLSCAEKLPIGYVRAAMTWPIDEIPLGERNGKVRRARSHFRPKFPVCDWFELIDEGAMIFNESGLLTGVDPSPHTPRNTKNSCPRYAKSK